MITALSAGENPESICTKKNIKPFLSDLCSVLDLLSGGEGHSQVAVSLRQIKLAPPTVGSQT